MRAVAQLVPFLVNNYVVGQLSDRGHVPDDPLFQLPLPQRSMLAPQHFAAIEALLGTGGSDDVVKALDHRIRMEPPNRGGSVS